MVIMKISELMLILDFRFFWKLSKIIHYTKYFTWDFIQKHCLKYCTVFTDAGSGIREWMFGVGVSFQHAVVLSEIPYLQIAEKNIHTTDQKYDFRLPLSYTAKLKWRKITKVLILPCLPSLQILQRFSSLLPVN